MTQRIRPRWAASHVLVFMPFLLIAIVSPFHATEPDGHLRLHVDQVQPDSANGPPVVRLGIRSHVPLSDVTLTVSTPIEFDLRPLAATFQALPAGQGRQAIRGDLRNLDTVAASTVDFELSLSPGRRGIVEFIVEGRDSRGRMIRGAIGVAAGEAPNGVRRLDAIEFPARVLPPAEKR